MNIIKTIIRQLKKRPVMTTMYIIVATFVIVFVSIVYSSLRYNEKVKEVLSNGYKEEQTKEYNIRDNKNGELKNINKEALDKILENCDMEVYFSMDIDGEHCSVSLNYFKNKIPEIPIYDENIIEKPELNKAYLGKRIRESYSDKVKIMDKTYSIGKIVGVKSKSSKFDGSISIYTKDKEDIYKVLSMKEQGFFKIKLGIYNEDYDGYEKDINEMLGNLAANGDELEQRFLVDEIKARDRGIGEIRYGVAYVSLIIIGITTIISISYFWINNQSKDIGIKKAFGAKKIHLVSDIYKELVSMCILSGIMAYIISYFIKISTMSLTKVNISVNLKEISYFFISMVALSILTAIIPILGTSKVQIIEALKERR